MAVAFLKFTATQIADSSSRTAVGISPAPMHAFQLQ
jgi:hypothetical protein